MPRKSKIDRLDPGVQDAIAALRARGRTVDEIIAHLRSLDLPADALPVRSGMIAHVRKLDDLAAATRKRRLIAEALAPTSGQLSPLLRHVFEMVMGAAQDVLDDAETGAVDPEALHDLAKAIDHMARAGKALATTPEPPPAAPAAKAGRPADPAQLDADAAERARRAVGF